MHGIRGYIFMYMPPSFFTKKPSHLPSLQRVGCSFCARCLYQCLAFNIKLFKTDLLLKYMWYQVSVLETICLARKTVKQNFPPRTSFPVNLVKSSSVWLNGKTPSKHDCQNLFQESRNLLILTHLL